MTRRAKTRKPRKPVVPLPLYAPTTVGVWLIAAPALAQLFLLLLIGLEADSSTEVLISLILSSGGIGAMLSVLGYGLPATALASAWMPALFAWRHWYWALDMHSPGGSAQWIVGSLGWRDAAAPRAVAAVCAASAAGAWLVLRLGGGLMRRAGT